MTYKELAAMIGIMNDEQQSCDATVYLSETDEYLPVNKVGVQDEDDVLDKNHPFLTIDF